jgi:CRISPR type I-E-associated protein CasB/Cse2
LAREELIENYYNSLKKLSDAEKSRLRRSASNPTRDTRIFDILSKLPIPPWAREKLDLCAVLYSITYQCPETENDDFNLGNVLEECGFSDIRMRALLDTDVENLNFRLRQVFSFVNGKNKPLNWKTITSNILNWENESKYVQRKWAEGFYAKELKNKKEQTNVS